MDQFILRPLTSSDAEFLWEMLYQAIHVPEGSTPPPRDIIYQPELAHYAEGWGRPGDLGWVAVEVASQKPVGAVWLRLLAGANRGYGWVDDHTPELSIAILPGYRGHGLGTRLIEEALHYAPASYPAVSLSVSNDNGRAAALYHRLGFETVSDDGSSQVMRVVFEGER